MRSDVTSGATHRRKREAASRFVENYPDLKGQGLAFATLVEGMDKSLGDMISHLVCLGVAEETLVIFLSDNGSAWASNAPYRDKKGSRFEGGFRVPMIVAWAKPNPENPLQKRYPIEPGTVEHDLVTCVDVMPTLVKLANAHLPANSLIDGHDLSPYFFGVPGMHRPQEFLSHFPHRHRNTLFSTLRIGKWKIIYQYANASWELYNLAEDPLETKNLVMIERDRAKQMAIALVERLDSQKAQYPVDARTKQSVKPRLDSL